MLLFRSEEHIDAWYGDRERGRGATIGLDPVWGLADAWYSDRMSPDWRRRTVEEAQELFSSLGLTGDFWDLTG